MKLGDDIETNIILRNNTPVDDLLGLTPNDLHSLLYDTLGDKSPVQLRNNIDNEVLGRIPLFRIAEEYLRIIQRNKQIKLTPLGALPKKVMVELYSKRLLLDENIESGLVKLWKEQDCISIMSARLTIGFSGLVKKANGKISLTKNGTKLLLTENRNQLFKTFFQAFTDKFLWSFNDGYPEQPIGQLGWAFSVFMLYKFSDEAYTADFYADKYLKAFPKFIIYFKGNYSTPEAKFTSCYCVRTFDRFLLWFGFVTVDKQGKYLHSDTAKFIGTDLLKRVFIFS